MHTTPVLSGNRRHLHHSKKGYFCPVHTILVLFRNRHHRPPLVQSQIGLCWLTHTLLVLPQVHFLVSMANRAPQDSHHTMQVHNNLLMLFHSNRSHHHHNSRQNVLAVACQGV